MLGIINGKIERDLDPEQWRAKGHLYEVVRVTEGVPLFLEEHLLRMEHGAPGLVRSTVEEGIRILIREAGGSLSRNIFVSLDRITGDLALFFIDSFYPPEDWYLQGVDIDVLPVRRENPNLKVYDTDYKHLVSAHLHATGFFETLISDEGLIKEGSRSNVFFIGKGILHTPPVTDVLPGITREKVFEIAGELGIPIVEKPVAVSGLPAFTGAFLTGTSIDLLPVRQIGEQRYATVEDPLFRILLESYDERKREDRKRHEGK